MKNKKDFETINGRIQTKNFSCSINKELIEPLIDIFGGGTDILRKFFIIRLKLDDEWDLENYITKKLLEGSGIGKRKKLTTEVEKTMSKYIIDFYEEKLKTKKLNKNEEDTIKYWIKKASKILKDKEKEVGLE